MERKLLLLGILRQQEMHGYQLFEFIERSMAICTDLTKPTAYHLLNKMAEDGWISEEQNYDGNRPPRKVFRLTQQGEVEFQRMLRENLAAYAPVNFPGDIGLAFLDNLPLEQGLDLLHTRREALAGTLEEARAIPGHRGSLQWVIQHHVSFLEHELTWLDELIFNITHSMSEDENH